jgi:hypothetical protein
VAQSQRAGAAASKLKNYVAKTRHVHTRCLSDIILTAFVQYPSYAAREAKAYLLIDIINGFLATFGDVPLWNI